MIRVLIVNVLIVASAMPGCGPKTPPSPEGPRTILATTALPEGIDPAQTSDDATYGYTRENPIRVGFPDEFSGPAASQVYLRHLRDAEFKPISFTRLGSLGGGPDGHMLDKYQITTSSGQKFELYIDMYHPEHTPLKQLAPKGFYFWK